MVAFWQSLPPLLQTWLIGLGKGTLILIWALANFAVVLMLDRKISAWIQNRLGPWRVGLWGWIQPIADLFKLFVKEFIDPNNVDRPLYLLAPFVSFLPAILVWLIIPFWNGGTAMDLDIGIIYIAAITGFDVIAVFMSGWGSDNKYSLLGSMRGAAQMISYEVTLVLSIIGVVMMAGSLRLSDIVMIQDQRGVFGWFLFPQIIGFIVYLIASLAELNRTPFDLVEAESELVAGYHTEYSGFRWGFFMVAEYVHQVGWAAIAASLFLGGWSGPSIPDVLWGLGNVLNIFGALPNPIGNAMISAGDAIAFLDQGVWAAITGMFWFVFKIYVLIFLGMWIRWTLPRVRIDQLMDLGWKFLLPVSLFNIFLTGILKYAAIQWDGLPIKLGAITIRLLGLWT
ncbi:MAG TPA: NADH-quinone oxidoreductase subunit NuoH [Symbiobacteriaceae bacterium]